MCLRKWGRKVMAVLEHFLFNSDYPTDKLVFLQEGSVKPTSTWQWYFKTFNTKIKTQLYFEGDYSIQGSTNVYPITNSKQYEHMFVALASFMYNGECYVSVGAFTVDSGTINKTVNFRVWGIYGEEDAKNTDIGQTANAAKPKLTLTSDEEYPRFVGEGHMIPGEEYQHKLGFIPMLKAWGKFNGDFPISDTSTTVNVDYYEPIGFDMYFGYPPNSQTGRSQHLQVTKNKINTYTEPSGSGLDQPIDIYFRMYTV